MPGKPIAQVVVAGGGLVAWSAAAALRKRVPALRVTVVSSPPPDDALADTMICTLPSINGFHGDLGLSDEDAVLRTNSGYRLGTRHRGWATGRADYLHTYGPHGAPIGIAAFHQHWVRAASSGEAIPFDHHSAGAAMARAGRFAHTGASEAPALAQVEHGLTIDPVRYGALLRAFALHHGALERPAGVLGVRQDGETGAIAALALDDGGEELGGDLFIDCTGPAATIRSAVDPRIESWSHWFACDRMMSALAAESSTEPPLLDEVTALDRGWAWKAAAPGRASHGLVYHSATLGDEGAARRLADACGPGSPGRPVPIRPGVRTSPWIGNCLAIGDAAIALEPLEWTALHLAHSAIDRLVAMLPDCDFVPVELAEYNRQCTAEAERVRDFVLLHYHTADRPEPFWREVAAVEPPASLAHTLRLFKERGRLPLYEEETFARDSWLAVLLGQGVLPRRVDALTDTVPPAEAAAFMHRWRQQIEHAALALPPHGAYLAMLRRQTARW